MVVKSYIAPFVYISLSCSLITLLKIYSFYIPGYEAYMQVPRTQYYEVLPPILHNLEPQIVPIVIHKAAVFQQQPEEPYLEIVIP